MIFASPWEILEAYGVFGIITGFWLIIWTNWSASEKAAAAVLWPVFVLGVVVNGMRSLWRRFYA